MSPASKPGGAPAPATPKASGPATPPAAAPKTAGPRVTPQFGDIYLQPQRASGDTPGSYRARLTETEMFAAKQQAPRYKEDSFTLLTQRGEGKGGNEKPISLPSNRTQHEAPYEPGYGKVHFTGEARFDTEIEDLENRKQILEKEMRVESNEFRKKKYEYELEDINKALPIFKRAAAMHYTEGKTDAAFYSHPVKQKDTELLDTLEWYAHLKGKRGAVKMGNEIQERRTKEIRELKSMVETLSEQLELVRDKYTTLEYEAKKAIEGKMPDHMKDTLIQMELLLKDLQKASENDEPFEPPTNGRMEKMQKLVDNLLQGNIFDELETQEIKQEMLTTHDILTDMLTEGVDITHDSLVARGLSNDEATATIDLLKSQGVLPN